MDLLKALEQRPNGHQDFWNDLLAGRRVLMQMQCSALIIVYLLHLVTRRGEYAIMKEREKASSRYGPKYRRIGIANVNNHSFFRGVSFSELLLYTIIEADYSNRNT